ncbi:MAG: YicC/YloC family endoribonuclease [Clostridia bacterium]|nr:YicC/YloC family endoribonuclease [Clostridia bacterium]
MLKSMTGFSVVSDSFDKWQFEISIKTLNSRYLDCHVRMNNNISFLEPKLRAKIKEKISRGKVEVFVALKINEDCNIDTELFLSRAEKFTRLLRETKQKCNIIPEVSMSNVLRCPDLFRYEDDDLSGDEFIDYFLSCFDKALDNVLIFRQKEGEVLKTDVTDCCRKSLAILELIKKEYPRVIEDYKNRLSEKIKEVLKEKDVNEDRVLTEIAILSDKITVHEETIRLENHLNNLINLTNSKAPVGKKMDFTIQEANREVNTIGSKINDIKISALVIDIKAEIEKMREQVQNIE